LFSRFESDCTLKDNSKYEVLIIGGGLAGLSLLYHLRKGGVDALLVESNSVASGASGRNGGFCLSGWAQDYEILLKYLGVDTVKELERIASSGVKWMKKKCLQRNFSGAQLSNGVLNCYLSGELKNIEQDTEKKNRLLGISDKFLSKKELDKIILSDKYLCGVEKENGFHFHPLNFMIALAKECVALQGKISEKTQFIGFSSEKTGYLSQLIKNNKQINVYSKKIVFATGGYGGHELKDLKKYWLPIKTFIGVTEPLGERVENIFTKSYAVSDNRRAGNYFRVLPDKRLSWGSGISAYGNMPTLKLKRKISKEINYFFPQLGSVKIDYAWSGKMAYASHAMPYVGPVKIGSEKDDVFVIMGFGGHGMNTAAGAAIVLSNFLLSGSEEFKVFNNFKRKWNGGLIGPYVAELKYKYIQTKDFFDGWRNRGQALN
jgi:glycine/D-amino acid oxidase-like deaminating enzyme